MKATIFFDTRNYDTGEHEGFALMATVECGDRTGDRALDYAYSRIQNVEGSWSRPMYIGDEFNPDFSEDVSVLKPLETYNGKKMGHRSMMIGDRIIFDSEWYQVDMIGFKKLTKEDVVRKDVFIAPVEVA